MEKLLEMLISLVERIELRAPEMESVEWYLLNNLNRFKEILENSPSKHEFENGMRVLSRFCIDSMDWNSPLFKAATSITEQARRQL